MIGVLGAGSWGTALAQLLAEKGEDVRVWSFEPDVTDTINHAHENTKYLPGIALNKRLKATSNAVDAVRGMDVVVNVTPAQHVRRTLEQVATQIDPNALIVSASKGIETSTLKTMAEVVQDIVQTQAGAHAAFLSGPSFALEVAHKQPTAVTMAGHHQPSLERAQELFQSPYFRVYTNSDVIGVELAARSRT
jgi:glycerol-3-phosphate dehydrogenase (NAD(P)+)